MNNYISVNNNTKQITNLEIKKALYDSKFRNLFPALKTEIEQWINNPDCKCNVPLYNAILSDINTLKKYFGENIVITEPIISTNEPEQINQWMVINCNVDELDEKLQQLPHGPKQIAVARYEDQVTVIINDPIFN